MCVIRLLSSHYMFPSYFQYLNILIIFTVFYIYDIVPNVMYFLSELHIVVVKFPIVKFSGVRIPAGFCSRCDSYDSYLINIKVRLRWLNPKQPVSSLNLIVSESLHHLYNKA